MVCGSQSERVEALVLLIMIKILMRHANKISVKVTVGKFLGFTSCLYGFEVYLRESLK